MTNETKLLIGISVVTIAIVVGAAFFMGGKSSPTSNSEPIQNKDVLVRSDSHKIEAKGAKVTLVEFGDFQCPACGAAYPTITQVLEEYKGKINFVFRQFPLPMHKNAKAAAYAAEAAGEQGKFFEMYDKIYENQADWGESDKAMEFFIKYATDIKLDMDKFKTDAASKKYEKKVQKDIDDGYAAGVNSTPTFFINGIPQESGMQLNDYKEAIDSAITKSTKP